MKKSSVPKVGDFSKIDVEAFVRMKLHTSPTWAKKAALRIYDYQTPKEKRLHISTGHNGIGFSRFDAPLITSIVCRIRSGKILDHDTEVLQDIMPKYWAQIVTLSDKAILVAALEDYYRKQRAMPF